MYKTFVEKVLKRFRSGWARYSVADGISWREHYVQVRGNYEAVADDLQSFSDFSTALRTQDEFEVVPVRKLLGDRANDGLGKIRVGLRFDVDADPLTALILARILCRYGLPSSVFLLHTATYYGQFFGKHFVRSSDLRAYLDELISVGCEIGLHTDPYTVYCQHGIDGAEAVREEISWLRSHTGELKATSAHNSFARWGAASSEIFVERVLWDRDARTPEGAKLPLGVLSEAELGLEYEATFAVPKTMVDVAAFRAACDHGLGAAYRSDWLKRFLTENPVHDFAVDIQVWPMGVEGWRYGGIWKGLARYGKAKGWHEALEVLKEEFLGANVLVVMHPCYFLQDLGKTQGRMLDKLGVREGF